MILPYNGQRPQLASGVYIAESADPIGDGAPGCTIWSRCLIGMGSIVLNHARIGEGSIIAAGSLVPENAVVPPRSLFMGSPAQFRRHLTDKDLELICAYADHYVVYKDSYLAQAAEAKP